MSRPEGIKMGGERVIIWDTNEPQGVIRSGTSKLTNSKPCAYQRENLYAPQTGSKYKEKNSRFAGDPSGIALALVGGA